MLILVASRRLLTTTLAAAVRQRSGDTQPYPSLCFTSKCPLLSSTFFGATTTATANNVTPTMMEMSHRSSSSSSTENPPPSSPAAPPDQLASPPIISLEDLRSDTPHSPAAISAARKAFCDSRRSLGALAVRVGPRFAAGRRALLERGAWLALDPSPAARAARESCRAKNGLRVAPGWSGDPGGPERHPLQSGFYCNLNEETEARSDARGVGAVDPVFGGNVWPTGASGEGLRSAVSDVAELMEEVGTLVLSLARTAAVQQEEADGRRAEGTAIPVLDELTQSSTFCPLRLTYYDASYSRKDAILGDGGGRYWLPWHIDFNLATVFAPAVWIDERRALTGDGECVKDAANQGQDDPEKEAGLLLRNAAGEVVPAAVPHDCLLVQLGAHAQIASGGVLRAGPHAVGKLGGQQQASTKGGGDGLHDDEDRYGRLTFGMFLYGPWEERVVPPPPTDKAEDLDARVLLDDFGGLMRKAYTGETVFAGYQKFANYMNEQQGVATVIDELGK